MMRISHYAGTPNLGVFARAGERCAFVSPDASDEYVSEISETLNVECIRTSIAGSFVVGSLIALNSHGAVVSGLAEQKELKIIEKYLPVAVIDGVLNAAGNNILVNDNGAIVNPGFDDSTINAISKTLNVECVRGTIAGCDTVGSVCIATNKGAAVHPGATTEDLELIRKTLNVEPLRITLNHGVRTLSACALANDGGALVGDSTTPVEMGKLEDALHLY